MPKIKLVILGSGFGAFRVAMGISTSMYDVTVVSPRDHFLFTPLLASTTVGTTEFRSIIEPVRYSQKGVRSFTAHCSNIDTQSKTIHCVSTIDRDADFTLTYDVLVIAIGVVSADYGIPGVNEFALPIKELGDARRIRQQIISSIERATLPDITPEEQERLLTFVIVGGGPTGVEFAGELHDFIQQDLSSIFLELRGKFKIKLLDAGPTLLNAFDRSLGEYTKRIFRKRDIEILTSAPVKEVRHEEVVLEDDTVLPFGTLVWSAGVTANPLTERLPFKRDQQGRIITDEYLRVSGQQNIYAIGDCSTIQDKDDPMTAQAAQQEGKYLAAALNLTAQGRAVKPFRYSHKGMLAYIGGQKGLADTPAGKWRGFAAWVLWRSVYITRLVGFRNKFRVLFDWIRTSIFGRDIATF